MAKFAKRHYVGLARALSLARYNIMSETNYDRRTREYWAKFGFMTAARYIADFLERDNPKFNRAHFLAVVKGEVAADSRPSKVRDRGEE